MKDRINCWRHRWGKWTHVEMTVTNKRNGLQGEITEQMRVCSRCGRIQVQGLY